MNGCSYCYARKLANGRLRERYLANDSLAPVNEQYLIGFNTEYKPENDPFYHRFWPEKVTQPDRKRKPVGIFTCDMSDLFGDWIPFAWQNQIFTVIRRNSRHRFYLLTKQPQNLVKWSPFPDNCWVGVTATDTDMMLNATRYLSEFSAKIKYISFEPLLDWFNRDVKDLTLKALQYGRIKWLIIGACTGTLNELKPLALKYPELNLMPYGKIWTLQPKLDWVREIVEAADKAGIPVFLKDNLMPLMTEPSIPDLAWYAGLYYLLRQEMPK